PSATATHRLHRVGFGFMLSFDRANEAIQARRGLMQKRDTHTHGFLGHRIHLLDWLLWYFATYVG
ncbi:MAG TPA: hypothetical protein VFF31_21200, partial [Blastocatellia bacterium]|nr:hypothetical protein [Blastocatellia bacterium]